jgi:hypothetical protein
MFIRISTAVTLLATTGLFATGCSSQPFAQGQYPTRVAADSGGGQVHILAAGTSQPSSDEGARQAPAHRSQPLGAGDDLGRAVFDQSAGDLARSKNQSRSPQQLNNNSTAVQADERRNNKKAVDPEKAYPAEQTGDPIMDYLRYLAEPEPRQADQTPLIARRGLAMPKLASSHSPTLSAEGLGTKSALRLH